MTPAAGGARHTRGARGHGALRGVALASSAVLLFVACAAGALALRLASNLRTVDIGGLVGGPPSGAPPAAAPDPQDPSAGRALTVLVLGSDHRDAAAMAAEGRTTDGMRSDTTIVVHVSADRSRVEAVSIPRDSLVAIPSCLMSDGTTTPPRARDLVNSAFATGWDHGGDLRSAAACATRTVQDATGLTIDHVVVVDFAGFRAMVDAIGGVDLCIPQDLHDDNTGLTLAAGRRHLDGETAFKLARDRHDDVGDGSDIYRIGNQQRLVAAMVDQVLSRDVLTDVTRLVPFLSAATSSLTTDLGLPAITGLAYALRGVRPDAVTFLTVPWEPAPDDRDRVVWADEADDVWLAMAADEPVVPGDEPEPDGADGGAGTGADADVGATGSSSPPGAAPGPSSPAADPAPARTRQAGREPFTPADVTAVCS